MEVEGRAIVEGESVDRLVGIDGVRSEIVMMRTPDGRARIELDKFHSPLHGPDGVMVALTEQLD